MSVYLYEFTPKAWAWAMKNSTTAEVEATAKREIESLDAPLNEYGVPNIFFHTFEIGEQVFILTPRKGHPGIEIDTATMREGPVLDIGPFAGKAVMMPVPDSDDSEGRDV